MSPSVGLGAYSTAAFLLCAFNSQPNSKGVVEYKIPTSPSVGLGAYSTAAFLLCAFNSQPNSKGIVEYNIPMSPSVGLGTNASFPSCTGTKSWAKLIPNVAPCF